MLQSDRGDSVNASDSALAWIKTKALSLLAQLNSTNRVGTTAHNFFRQILT